jgi:hypothetical protein
MSFLTLIKKPVAESFDATSYGLTHTIQLKKDEVSHGR